MGEFRLYHGSEYEIKTPSLEAGSPNNDYGRGFYCTESFELSAEWACKRGRDGFSNEYVLNTDSLNMMDLMDESRYDLLNWVAMLIAHRTFRLKARMPMAAREYLIENHLPDTTGVDVIMGYRADDSYFSYAESFLNNTLPLEALSRAMVLGNLGIQVVLVSNRAFGNLTYVRSTRVQASEHFQSFERRDSDARNDYRRIQNAVDPTSGTFMVDIMRKGGI